MMIIRKYLHVIYHSLFYSRGRLAACQFLLRLVRLVRCTNYCNLNNYNIYNINIQLSQILK